MSMTDSLEQEAPLLRERAEIMQTRRELAVSTRTGLLTPKDLSEALEFSQAMAKAGEAVPKHLRGSPGACLAIIELAAAWELMAYGVANQSYVVKDRLCFMGQLVHAVIKKRAPLKYPALGLETRYEGSGPTRKVFVSAEVIVGQDGTTKVLEWESPMFKDIEPKNSPLWQTDPDQQLFYRTTSRWQRRYFPEIMLGVYTKDEIEEMVDDVRAELANDITPPKGTGIAARLSGGHAGEGFRPENGEILGAGADELSNIAVDVPNGKAQPEAELAADAKAPEQKTISDKPADSAKDDAKPAGETDANPAEPKATAKKERAKPAAKPTGPQTTGEYIGHLRTWLANHDVDTEILAQWGDEKKLRTTCGVMGEDLDTCVRMKNERLTEVRGK